MTKHIKITTFKYADEDWQEGVTLNKYYEVANESHSQYSFMNDNNMLRNTYKDFPMYQITERHPHAELMVTAAEIAKNRYDWWEEFDWRLNKEHEWLPMAEDSFYEKYDYRLKPRTIKIGNREINAPEREPLKIGQKYYKLTLAGMIDSYEWNECSVDHVWLKAGLIFLTKEDAIAAAEAMIALLSGE